MAVVLSVKQTGEDNLGFESHELSNGHPEATNEDLEYGNSCSRGVYFIQQSVYGAYKKNKNTVWIGIYIFLTLLYFLYFGYAMYYELDGEPSWRLLICTILAVILIVLNILWYVYDEQITNAYKKIVGSKTGSDGCSKAALIIGVTIFIVVYVIVDVAIDYPQNLIAVVGQALYIILFYIFSTNPAKVRWHPVFWGFALQYVFAIIILRWYYGYQAFKWLGDRVAEFLAYADEGAKFLFGDVFEEHFFAFKVLSIVVFFYSFISMMYYLGVMQALIRVIAYHILNTEAPLLIKPFLSEMTKSELHAVMTGGFATIAGSVLGAFMSFGKQKSPKLAVKIFTAWKNHRNIVEAASAGATSSIKMVAGIAVNVLAFLSILKMVNATLTWFGERAGVEGVTFQFICSYVLYPVAFFMGTETVDCRKVAELIGIKTFINEFVAYLSLSEIIANKVKLANYTTFYNETGDWFWDKGNIILKQTNETLNGGILSEKSTVIATYALCGFSNIGSMGILLGGLGALAPSKRGVLPKIVVRAVVSGTVACFLTACIAGLLFKDY
ncbi:hypothetical protein KUTeg_008193 [Tegillarca granosa]|uniref:Sodium/nucleoside cotransporter n=1 Tax=Tegillarca granosa TaxID=220873 RepID=A0ABQ9FCQ3_TEGGR|nr:hypothetical protein KUTeg_008193 [Tegillarca granosa]